MPTKILVLLGEPNGSSSEFHLMKQHQVVIVVSGDTYKVIKNRFTGFQGAEHPLASLPEYLKELKEVDNNAN
jgi:hypothetical protein